MKMLTDGLGAWRVLIVAGWIVSIWMLACLIIEWISWLSRN